MIGIRWTMGDVSPRGFEALQLSVWGVWRLLGDAAEYCICINNLDVEEAQRRTGDLPRVVRWRDVTHEVPRVISDHMDGNMAEGVGWKLAPLRVFPDAWEISLDNDAILWQMPQSIAGFLEQHESCLMAQDVKACFGQFAKQCGEAPTNAGIRGLPPGFDLEAALGTVIKRHPIQPVQLQGEVDEQGLQTAALSLHGPPILVPLEDVTICSPFWPHLPHLGRCGAHFVGLNARHIPWNYYDRPADECMAEHWMRHREELWRRAGIAEAQPACAP